MRRPLARRGWTPSNNIICHSRWDNISIWSMQCGNNNDHVVDACIYWIVILLVEGECKVAVVCLLFPLDLQYLNVLTFPKGEDKFFFVCVWRDFQPPSSFSSVYPVPGHCDGRQSKATHMSFSLSVSASSRSQSRSGPAEIYNPFNMSWVCPGGFSQLETHETPPAEVQETS